MLDIGKKAPDFKIKDHRENFITLSSFLGKWIILYFYPKDNTPACTQEAKDFSDIYNSVIDKNGVIIGVSKDTVKSHQKFIDKYQLSVLLLSDPDLEVIKKYNVWKKKKMFGKEYMGVERTTFLINPQGNIQKIWKKVKVKEHALMVYESFP